MLTVMPLSVIDPKEPFQSEYEPAIIDLIKFLKGGLGSNLHSIYIYGSVARKTAQMGKSNLDVIVVTYRSFDDTKTTLLNTINWRFKRSFSYITHLSIRTALKREVIDLQNIFTWGFMLKHCTVCVYGNDLADFYGEFEPSWEIAKHWNGDVEEWLKLYRLKIAQATTAQEQINAQKIIAKKLLRASYSLIMHKDKYWYDDPRQCGEHFLHYHPDKQLEIERLGYLSAAERAIPKRSVIGLLDSFGSWLLKEYQRTEFKIG